MKREIQTIIFCLLNKKKSEDQPIFLCIRPPCTEVMQKKHAKHTDNANTLRLPNHFRKCTEYAISFPKNNVEVEILCSTTSN